jgi:hypothetical protein
MERSVKIQLDQEETRRHKKKKKKKKKIRMLFITDSIQLVQREPYPGSS